MPHTQGRYQQDLGFTDAKLFAGPGDVVQTGTVGVLTRVPPGYNLVFPNTSNSFVGVNVSSLIQRRLGFFEDLQEQFGGAGISGSAQIRDYRPDVRGTGAAPAGMSVGQQLIPRAAFKTKGFRLISLDVIYTIAGANLTSQNIRIDSVQYSNNLAPVNTVILASAANGLAVATQAQPYVTTVTPAIQPYFTLNDASLWIDLAIVTPGGGTYTFFGFDVAVEFNFN
jgi:hypothetical protein